MSKRDLKLLLQDIQECLQRIKEYTENYSFEDFANDRKTVDAVIRNFEIIGEASSNIETDFKTQNPQVGWRRMKDFRNRMIHDYTGVDYSIVWEVITKYLDELEFQIDNLIKEIE
jgi:uncharacterized protein with HEPN domain